MIHLHVHSHFSPLGGLSSPQDLIDRALRNGQQCMALTDTNGFYGLVSFVEQARDSGLRPIIGVELIPKLWSGRMVLLAKNQKGYQGICRILSSLHQGFLEWERCLSFLEEVSDSIVIFSDDRDFLLELKQNEKAFTFYYELTKGFFTQGDLVWLEENDIAPLASLRVHYLERVQESSYRLLRAIAENSTMDQVEISSYHRKYCYMASGQEIKNWYELVPQAIENSLLVANMCDSSWFGKKIVFPRYRNFSEDECSEILRERAIQAIDDRCPGISAEKREQVLKRIKKEMEVVRLKGFSSYFLTVADIVSFSEIHCGRGSGAASIICFLLGITHVDVIDHRLFFERFLNHDRVDLPDIDIDFPWDERDQVLDYVFDKFKGQAAMVANHNFLRGRSAVREVAKVWGVREDEISYVLDRYPRINLSPKWSQIFLMASGIEGCLRHLSVHCGGVVITPGPIENYVPVEMARKGVPVIQWEKDQTEDAGLVKIDLLGNRSLAVIRDCINAVNLNYSKNFDYPSFNPVHDEKTKKIMKEGETMGCFYIESPGTRLYLKKQKSGEFEHNVIAGSVIRPAARVHANDIARRINGTPFKHLHPLLASVLEETYGVMIYQEQVTQVAMVLADFSVREGNDLRKVLTKKHKEKKLSSYRKQFFEVAERKGVPKRTLEKIWDMIMSFAGYSFCKPHSASYCLVSYKAAFLKAHYPAEFMAAVISNRGGFYSTEAYLDEARRQGIDILPPDINLSEDGFVAEKGNVRTGLSQIKYLKSSTIKKIIEERKNGDFLSLRDFLRRVQPVMSDARVLNLTRAFKNLGKETTGSRSLSQTMWEIFRFYKDVSVGADIYGETEKDLPKVKEYDQQKIINWEIELLQGHVTFPEWFLYRKQIAQGKVFSGRDFPSLINKELRFFGIKVTEKRIRTKNGETMSFVSFSDMDSIYETVFFPAIFYSFRDLLFLGGAFWVEGIVKEELGSFYLEVRNLVKLADDFEVFLADNDAMSLASNLLEIQNSLKKIV